MCLRSPVSYRTRWLAAALLLAAAPALPQGQPLVLENNLLRLELDPLNGGIVRLLDRGADIDLQAAPGLADSFRLLLGRPGELPVSILGSGQRLSSFETAAGAIELRWDGPLRDDRGNEHDLSVQMAVRLSGPAAELRLRLRLRNRATLPVAEVWYPFLPGLLHFAPEDAQAETAITIPPYDKRFTLPFGEFIPTYPGMNMAFVDVTNPRLNRGLYIGCHDPLARYKGFRFAEVGEGDRRDITFNLMHFPYTPPGDEFEGAPLALQFHPGGWKEGGAFYRDWFIGQFGLMDPADDWIRRQSFYQMTMFMLPEGNVNYTFADIPRWAAEAKKYGMEAVQIAGWQRGGHDNGYPYYEPDPRLGTWEELAAGIRAVHDMGMRIYFFVNLQVVMLDIDWYQRELKDYLWENGSGDAYWIAGWGMGTLASRLAHTVPLMAFSDTSFAGLADPQAAYFRKLASIGADGIHIDKMFPGHMNFNPRVAHPDQSVWEGAIGLIERIGDECRALNPDFRISFECNWDRVLSYGAGTWWAGNMSNARVVFPELVETVGLLEAYDYAGVNNAVRQGHTVMVAPHHFTGGMDAPAWRGLSGYIREVKRIRDELADLVFLGQYLGQTGLGFGQGGMPSGIAYGHFQDRSTGRHAWVLMNGGPFESSPMIEEMAGSRAGRVRIYRPFQPVVGAELPTEVAIEPERLAFVVEE